MSDEQTTPRIIAFVSGIPAEQEEQETKIKKFCETHGYCSGKEINFFSEWDKINKNLQKGDHIIIADLKDLAGNCKEIAERLYILFKKGIYVELVNEEHSKLLCWNERIKNVLGDERTLVGLKLLIEKILKGNKS